MATKQKKTRNDILLEKGISIGNVMQFQIWLFHVVNLMVNFETGEKLDSGGFGTVYKARHKGQTVAVKVIKIDPRKKSLDEDLNRELAILLRVNKQI